MLLFQRLLVLGTLYAALCAAAPVALLNKLQRRSALRPRSVQIEQGWTNGVRLAAGLPPLPPKFKRTFPGETRAHPHPRDLPSPSASADFAAPTSNLIRYTGNIEVRDESGSSLGFVQNSDAGINSTTKSSDNALAVRFTTTPSGRGPFNLIAENAAFSGPVSVGAVGKSALGSTSESIVRLDHVESTTPLSRPGSTGGESHIWSFNSSSKELTAQWINPNGSRPHTSIAYDSSSNALFFTKDVTSYAAHTSSPVVEVHLFLASG